MGGPSVGVAMRITPLFRIGLASVVAIAAIGAAVAVTIQGYRTAVDKRSAVAISLAENALVQHAELLLTAEAEEMNEYLLDPDPEILAEIRERHTAFRRVALTLGVGEPDERPLALRALAEHGKFIVTFDAGKRSVAPEGKAQLSRRLGEHEETMLAELRDLKPPNELEAAMSQQEASQTEDRALVAGLSAGGLAILGGLGFALYAFRLVRRTGRQNEALRQLDGMKDDFVASVSHELRTPLTSINGYLELILDEDQSTLTEEQKGFLGVIRRNADRLQRLVGDLLLVAQLDSSAMVLKRAQVDLAALARQAFDGARAAAEDRGVELTLECAEVATLDADADRLIQIIDKLLSNALKFTPPGGRIDLRLRAEGDTMRFEVADTGPGISSEDQLRLFDRFFRSSNAITEAVQGTGVGLSIVDALVRGHGGTIEVESEVGVGSTFTMVLPIHSAGEMIAA
jgi:signal transduction histidine kinase